MDTVRAGLASVVPRRQSNNDLTSRRGREILHLASATSTSTNTRSSAMVFVSILIIALWGAAYLHRIDLGDKVTEKFKVLPATH